jgi:hypothetical protein
MARPLPPSTWPATVSAGRCCACGPIRHSFWGWERFPNGNRLPSRLTSPATSTLHLSLSHVAPTNHNLNLLGNRDANTPGIMVSYFAAHPHSHLPFPDDDTSPPSMWPATVLVGQRCALPRFSASALISKWNPPSLTIYQPGCDHPSFIAQPCGSHRPQSRLAGQSRHQYTRYICFLFHCSFPLPPPFPDGDVSPPRDQPQFLLASIAPADTRTTVCVRVRTLSRLSLWLFVPFPDLLSSPTSTVRARTRTHDLGFHGLLGLLSPRPSIYWFSG